MTEEAFKVPEEAMNKAFDAIHDEALRLRSLTPSDLHELLDGLGHIAALARYKFPVRSEENPR